jgi:hypothetical protein
MYSNADELKAQLEPFNEVSATFVKFTNDARVTEVGKWMHGYS